MIALCSTILVFAILEELSNSLKKLDEEINQEIGHLCVGYWRSVIVSSLINSIDHCAQVD